MTDADNSSSLSKLMRLTFQFLDLSRDVDRNRDDAAFQESGGQLVYIFDENIFELFINPHDRRGWTASLHAPDWSDGAKGSGSWRSYVAQTVLSTTEFLMSGHLKGQSHSRILMTEWHRWELARRVHTLRDQIVRQLRSGAKQDLGPFAKLRLALDSFDKNTGRVRDDLLDRELIEDLDAYRGFADSPEDLYSFLSTRLTLGVLADDKQITPAAQIRRIVTPPIRQQIRTLHVAYPPNEPERHLMAEDARRWFRLLTAECRLRGIEVARRDAAAGPAFNGAWEDALSRSVIRSRPAGAVWDDAQSLALARWVAVSRASRAERVVFVTADSILFDTYRRWYANLLPDDAAYVEPFIMRRIGQYAPIFNLVDSSKITDERYRDLFRHLEQTLEVTLLPLNLSRMQQRGKTDVITRMRELTALRLTDDTPIDRDMAYRPLVDELVRHDPSSQLTQFQLIVDRWRELERSALGQATGEIRARLDEEAKLLTGFADEIDEEGASRAFKAYLGDIVQNILEESHKLWLPLAREFIDGWRAHDDGRLVRAPIALYTHLEVGDRRISLSSALDDRAGDGPLVAGDVWPALYNVPHVVFALAATLAVVSNDWSNAAHFSQIALQLLRESDPDRRPERSIHAEILYLAALSQRFSIGDVGPPLTAEAFGRIERHYRSAEALLDECLILHEPRADDADQRLKMLRATSERAALRLFYSSCLNPNVRVVVHRRWRESASRRGADRSTTSQNSGMLDFGVEDQAVEALNLAELDLRRCLDIDQSLPPMPEGEAAEFRYRLQRQYYTNIAAAAVLRWLWKLESGDSKISVGNPIALSSVKTLLERHGTVAHPVMKIEALAFLALGGDKLARAELITAKEDLLAKSKSLLSIDSALVEAIGSAFVYTAQDSDVSI